MGISATALAKKDTVIGINGSEEEISQREKLYSIDDYYKMAEIGILKPDEKTELINGKVIFMSPVGNKHINLVMQLSHNLILQVGMKHGVSIQSPVKIDAKIVPEPDLVVLRKSPEIYIGADLPISEAVLVIEVANSTLKNDLTNKLKLYASAGVPEYWVVDLVNNQLICFTKPKGDQYLKEVSTKKAFNSPTVKGLTVDLSRFWELDEKNTSSD